MFSSYAPNLLVAAVFLIAKEDLARVSGKFCRFWQVALMPPQRARRRGDDAHAFQGQPGPSMCAPGADNKVMHTSFRIGDTTMMASDGRCEGKPSFFSPRFGMVADRFGVRNREGEILRMTGSPRRRCQHGTASMRVTVFFLVVNRHSVSAQSVIERLYSNLVRCLENNDTNRRHQID